MRELPLRQIVLYGTILGTSRRYNPTRNRHAPDSRSGMSPRAVQVLEISSFKDAQNLHFCIALSRPRGGLVA